MRNGQRNFLPKILVIDDQFGRCSLGGKFRKSVSPEIHAGYEADRKNLCVNFGLLDVTGDVRARKMEDPLAEAIFCPAQEWDNDARRIENSADVALRMVRRGWPFEGGSRWALVLLDLRFVYGTLNAFGDPQEGALFGLEVLLPRLRQDFGPDLPVVVLSSTNKDENNPLVRQLGALDFIQRVPGAGAPPQESRDSLKRTLFQHGLLEDSSGLVIGRSLPVLKMLRQARRGGMSARSILLLGETGTGKGVLARYIHSVSDRKYGPFEVFHAAHRPPELQADELFGHWKGAFTGAVSDAPGIWERANGGAVFIDEVADIDVKVQQMLMQPIEERKVRRVGQSPSGSSKLAEVDVLVLLATNRRLRTDGQPGSVKLDFLNRINAFTIEVPPLRDRIEDLPELVEHLVESIAPKWHGKLLPTAMDVLVKHQWAEGNIRELRNVIERAIVNNPGQDITGDDILLSVQEADAGASENDSSVVQLAHRWRKLARAIQVDPETMSVAESQTLRRELDGAFLELLAHAMDWSLRLTRQDDKANMTAAARFLLGRDDVSTMDAKQFIRRLLTLDARDKGIARCMAGNATVRSHATLGKLLADILKTG